MEKIADHIKEWPKSPITKEIINFFDNNWGKDYYLSLAIAFAELMVVKISKNSGLKKSFALDRENYSFYKMENYEQGNMPNTDFWTAISHLHYWCFKIALEVFPEEKAKAKNPLST